MKSALKYLAFFAINVFVLSLKVNNQTVFSYFYRYSSWLAESSQSVALDFFNSSINKSQDFSKKIFNNSIPRLKDSVQSKSSSIQRENNPEEDIENLDREQLDELIKSRL